jgi:hypothetical protein
MIRHTANPPVRGASAPAAKAAPSSCLRRTQLMSFRVRIEPAISLSEFPGPNVSDSGASGQNPSRYIFSFSSDF